MRGILSTTMKRFAFGALGLVCVVVVAVVFAKPAIAQSPFKPVLSFIVNDPANPVPVAVQGSVPVAVQGVLPVLPPVWQGTPFLKSHIVLNNNSDGFQQCETVFTAPAGSAVVLKTISTDFNVPPGTFGLTSANARVPGGQLVPVSIPAPRTAPVFQFAGLYDAYAGSVDMGGLPVVELQGCLEGVKSAGQFTAIGFSVPLPQ